MSLGGYQLATGAAYYRRSRDDLLDFAARHMSFEGRALDIGCAEGVVGVELLRMGFTEVWGVEPDEKAANVAAERLTHVIHGQFPCAEVAAASPYDVIVFADSLEHMIDPWAALSLSAGLLKTGGGLLISVPNISHYTIISALLRECWEYEDEGLLDRSHLRFFTPRSIRTAVEAAGFDIQGRGSNRMMPRRRFLALIWAMKKLAPHMLVWQTYIYASRRPEALENPVVSAVSSGAPRSSGSQSRW